MSRDLKLLLAQLAPLKGRYALGMLALAVADGGQLLSAHLVGRTIDSIDAAAIDGRGLALMAGAIFGAGAAVAVARYAWRHLIFGSARRIERQLRQRLHDHLLSLSPRFFMERKIGELMAHATNDIQAVQLAAANGMMFALDAGIVLIGATAMMGLTVDWNLALAALSPLLLLSPATLWLGHRLHLAYGDVQAGFATLSDQAQENVAGVRVVKGFAQEPVQAARFAAANEDYRARYADMLRFDSAFEPVIGLLSGLSFAIGLWYGGILVVGGTITLGSYVAFNSFLAMLAWPMMALGFMTNRFQRASASMARLQALFDTAPEIYDAPDARALPSPRGHLELRDLDFRYAQDLPLALEDLSLDLQPGRSLGILGHTGSGKSSIANLILRQFEPPEGRIFLDGQDVRGLRLTDLRRAIAYVPQDAFLFSTSIAENIAFDPDSDPADLDAIEAAARMAGVDRDIEGFADGYATLLGERGITLSGGQRQRVSLARALLRRAPILILDDALSAVDTETEARILGALRQGARERSTIIIAHRVSAVQHAEEIILLAQGRVIERGDHASLLAAGGAYASLHRKQQLELALEGA
jgi:ATP-binding cassette subfamily B protein